MISELQLRDEYFFKKFKIYSNIKLNFSNSLLFENDNLPMGLLKEVKLQTNRVKIPIVVYYGISNIESLDFDYFTFTNDDLSYFREFGLNFCLIEPLTTYHTQKQDSNWYTEYSTKEESFIKAKELDSISNFCQRHNFTNVTVYSPEYNIDLIFANKYPSLKLKTKNLVYPFNQSKKENLISPKDIKKKFWCGNNRYSSHRHVTASYLISSVPSEDLNLSWLRESNITHLTGSVNLDLFQDRKNIIVDGIKILDHISPISFDLNLSKKLKKDDKLQIDFNLQNPAKSYKESFCVVITETRFFQSTTVISEKIVNAILNKKFFILVAPPHTLKYLKQFGFKTFDRWIDESYDKETCHNTRLTKIFNLIDYINSKNIDELIIMQKEMTSILLHNYNVAKSGITSKQFLQTLEV